MVFTFTYDKKNAADIERHAKQLTNHSLSEYINASGKDFTTIINPNNKGKIGQLIETILFELELNSRKGADFPEAGVELKVTPLKEISKGYSNKERMVLSLINFDEVVKETWNKNSLISKLKLLLLMFYLHEQKESLDLVFKLVSLWTPSKADFIQIEKDWKFIVQKVKNGKAHEISEADTNYLGACTKGRDSSDVVSQPFSSIMATRRAFSLKSSYVRAIYNELCDKKEAAKAISQEGDFETCLLNVFSNYKEKTLSHIIQKNNLKTERTSKQFLKELTEEFIKLKFGAKSFDLEEFTKANITLKTILLKPNGIPKESMSFKQINYCDIVNEKWEDFEINKIHEDGRFFWIIFKATRTYKSQKELSLDEIILEKVMFWNMPYEDLQISYRQLWEDTKAKITKGDYNNFLKASEHPVGHIRPKAKDSNDLMLTPQGTKEPKKCFWINAGYIAEQMKIFKFN